MHFKSLHFHFISSNSLFIVDLAMGQIILRSTERISSFTGNYTVERWFETQRSTLCITIYQSITIVYSIHTEPGGPDNRL